MGSPREAAKKIKTAPPMFTASLKSFSATFGLFKRTTILNNFSPEAQGVVAFTVFPAGLTAHASLATHFGQGVLDVVDSLPVKPVPETSKSMTVSMVHGQPGPGATITHTVIYPRLQ